MAVSMTYQNNYERRKCQVEGVKVILDLKSISEIILVRFGLT